MPDRDFYFLVGLRHEAQGTPVERSFWANRPETKGRCGEIACPSSSKSIARKSCTTGPTRAICQAYERYPPSAEDAEFVDRLIDRSLNLLAVVYGRIYFPTYSNGLKDIARMLGFEWTWPQASGTAAMLLRRCWELTSDDELRRKLITYNIEDCRAAGLVTDALTRRRRPLRLDICQPDVCRLRLLGITRRVRLEHGAARVQGRAGERFLRRVRCHALSAAKVPHSPDARHKCRTS